MITDAGRAWIASQVEERWQAAVIRDGRAGRPDLTAGQAELILGGWWDTRYYHPDGWGDVFVPTLEPGVVTRVWRLFDRDDLIGQSQDPERAIAEQFRAWLNFTGRAWVRLASPTGCRYCGWSETASLDERGHCSCWHSCGDADCRWSGPEFAGVEL